MLANRRDQQIIDAYLAGLSMNDVGLQFGLTRARISQIIQDNLVPVRSQIPDLAGERFGRLLVVERKGSHWLCRCDCGNEITACTAELRNGHVKSCGCYRIDIAAKRFTTHGKTVKGKMTAEYHLYHSAKRRAKQQNVCFDIELEDIIIPEFCPVFPELSLRCNTGKVGDNSPTLDKLVPSLGYVKGNIRVISHKANTIKQLASPDEIRRVADWLESELRVKD